MEGAINEAVTSLSFKLVATYSFECPLTEYKTLATLDETHSLHNSQRIGGDMEDYNSIKAGK
jgi:hypothetical protein